MINYISALITLIIELFYLRNWLNCLRLSDNFYISKFDLQLRLFESISNDAGQNVILTRFFHNKATGAIFDLINSYLSFFNFKFLISLVSLLGISMFLYGLYLYFNNKKKSIWLTTLLIFLVTFPLIETIFRPNIDLTLKIIIFVIPISAFSLFGSFNFLKTKSYAHILIFIILLLISLFSLLNLTGNVLNFCFVK